MSVARRTLRFDDLDAVARDAERLLAAGYDKAGRWDLAQCCGHLAEWMRYQLDGFPPAPLLMRPVFWAFRKTLGPSFARKALVSKAMKPGLPTIPQSVPTPGAAERDAVQTLRATIRRWEAHAGPLYPSPLFGSLTKDEFRQGHLVHAAHHLSFLVPKQS